MNGQTLSEDEFILWERVQKLIWRSNLELDKVTLPSSLQTLTFGSSFNQSLDKVTLPSSLQTLAFGCFFNQSLDEVTLPSSLQTLIFGKYYGKYYNQRVSLDNNQRLSLDKVTLPSSLQTLICDSPLYEMLENVTLPDSAT